MVDFSAYTGAAQSTVVWVLVAACVGGILYSLFYLIREYTKYNAYKVVVWWKDAFGQIHESYDKAGIFYDKRAKLKLFWLKAGKCGLDPNKVPIIPGKKASVVYLFKTGTKNYSFIKPNINPHLSLTVGEEDVNWAGADYEIQKKVFQSNWLKEYAPYIAIAFVGIVMLLIFWKFFDKLDVLADMSQQLKEAAQSIAAAKEGTVVIQ